jgi:peptidyl-prolyl cis-trans isomerase B (cyclophilin B)
VSPTDRERDRARARRRYDKRSVALQARAAELKRNRQVVVVVAAVVLVVAGFVALTGILGKSSGAAAPPASAGTSSSSPASAPSGGAAGCKAPPPAPGAAAKAKLPPKTLAEGKAWAASIVTNCGTITVDLDGAKAPQTVSSFLALARSGFWAKSPCHRLTTSGIFVLQCGDPTGSGEGGPGYQFGIENAPASGTYPPGTLAMARSTDPGSNGSQFFIVYKPTQLPTAGGGYSIFGKVTAGLGIVDNIAAKGVAGGSADGAPAAGISILSVAAEKKA